MRTPHTASWSRVSPMLACSLLTAHAARAGGPYSTTLFSDIPNAVFLEISNDSSSAPFGPFVIPASGGTVTITSADESGSSPAFFGFFNYNNTPIYHLPSDPTIDPGDYHGYLRTITPFQRHVVLNFDTPLTGFGLTFVVQRFNNRPDQPDTIYAYDGPDATGNLIATVTTVNAPETNFKAQIDFVGIYVDGPPTIRSALVAGGPLAADNSELRITGIAVAISDSAPPCAADITGDGLLNFFDVAAYIALYNAGDPRADLAAPFGTLNFFDLAAYITLYNAGCP